MASALASTPLPSDRYHLALPGSAESSPVQQSRLDLDSTRTNSTTPSDLSARALVVDAEPSQRFTFERGLSDKSLNEEIARKVAVLRASVHLPEALPLPVESIRVTGWMTAQPTRPDQATKDAVEYEAHSRWMMLAALIVVVVVVIVCVVIALYAKPAAH